MVSVTIGCLLASITKSGMEHTDAYICIDAYGLNIIELPKNNTLDTPLEKRLGGICTYIRIDELCALAREKFGENIEHLTIKPLINRDGEVIKTDILIDSNHVSAIMREKNISHHQREKFALSTL